MSWLHHDHQQFESAIYCCRTACEAADGDGLRNQFDDFVTAYRLHVRAEEELLFPHYEQREGASPEPTESLRADHAQIFRLVGQITEQMERDEWANLCDELSRLYRVLARHHETEEKVFLPMASELLAGDKDIILTALADKARTG
jgi:hemerythrin superfamily protein